MNTKSHTKIMLVIILIIMQTNTIAQGQWAINGNSTATGDWFGTQNNRTLPFYTNSTQRMIIDNGSTGNTNGYVGIGNTFSAPASRLHIHQGTGDVWLQMTNNTTGNTYNHGLRIGVIETGSNVEIKQQENADMLFYTNNGTSTLERMRITSTGLVGIGVSSPSALLESSLTGTSGTNYSYKSALSNSVNSATNYSGYLALTTSGTGNTNYGIYNAITSTGSGTTNYGEWLELSGGSATNNYGIYVNCYASSGFISGGLFNVYNGTYNYGVQGIAVTGTDNYGGYFVGSQSSNDAIGMFASAIGLDNGTSVSVIGVQAFAAAGSNGNAHFIYGVYSSATSNCTGTSTAACPAAAGYFNGDVGVAGIVYQTSDINLKQNILPIQNANQILSQLNPVTYDFKIQQYPSMHLPNGNQYGIIAQDLLPVLPNLVKPLVEPEVSDSAGNVIHAEVNYLGVNYIGLIPLLVKGFNEQKLVIDSLINALNGQLKQSNPDLQNQGNKIEIELSNQNSIILNQNVSNPFEESTTISYNIPATVKTAQLIFYDNTGNVLKTVDILERGAGSVLVYASNLSKGVYNYTLLIDSKVFETKRMVKQ